MNKNLKKQQKKTVPIKTSLRRAGYLLLVFGFLYLVPKEVTVNILAAILEFAASVYDYITQFI
jgi:polyferredoxin|tara:strand:+ start:824 stop:1012 length:189 start_codon:yes stop_codon:yes gene_type:complete